MADEGLFGSLVNKYRDAVDMRKRTYGESLLKSFANKTNIPISNSNFTENELQALDKLIKSNYEEKIAYFSRPKKELLQDATDLEKNAQYYLTQLKTIPLDKTRMIEKAQNEARLSLTKAKQLKEAAQGKLPTDFVFGYSEYGERTGENKYTKDPVGWAQTLGRFRYKVDPTTGTYQAYDSYDFNNEVHKYQAENYSEMSPPTRMINALANTFISNDQYALGEAYLSGKNAIPVNITRTLQPQQNFKMPENIMYTDPFGNTIGSSIR
jgi:hypothetical protein